jgi:hypothetical protein
VGGLEICCGAWAFHHSLFVTLPLPYRTSPSFLGGQSPWQALQLSALAITKQRCGVKVPAGDALWGSIFYGPMTSQNPIVPKCASHLSCGWAMSRH